MTLGFKTYNLGPNDVIPFIDIETWLNSIDHSNEECRLVLRLETIGNCRSKKRSLKAELEALVADAFLKNEHIWQRDRYQFNFLARQYLLKGENVFITAGEQLYLFYKLVLKCDCDRGTFYINHMRQRLGKGFLKGYI